MRYLFIFLLLALVLITSGCTTTQQGVTTPQETITIVSTPAPVLTVTRPLQGIDPIIGAWDNGMVFGSDGYIGGDKNVSWRANDMVEYSYFVTTETRGVYDLQGGRIVDPTATATEWIYNPHSDTIHMRDTTAGVRRVLPGTVTATPVPTGT